ncbi:MAG: protease modulator HflC [Cytophagales bacterium]|nr:protease modulator HflC [Cytophagales bacterium]
MNKIGFTISVLLLALGFGTTCIFVVDQRQFAVVYTLAEIKEVISEPGLNFKLPPPLQSVTFIDKRILTLDSPETRAIQTAEKKNLVVDWLMKWRVKDAKQFIRNNNGANVGTAEARLGPLVQAALNEEVTKRTVKDVLSTDREKIVQGVKTRLADDAQTFGIEIVDVRIKRVDFPASVADSVYSRMVSERKQEANRLRSTGAAEGERIRADADKKREIVLATAYKDAQIVKGQGDAKSAAIFAEAFGRDPQFASFYRSLEAYKTTFAKKSDVMVMDPSSDFFKAMRSANTGGGSGGKK